MRSRRFDVGREAFPDSILAGTVACIVSANVRSPPSSDQEVQSGLAHADAIAAVERARLPRFKVDNIIDDRAVDRTEVFDHESGAVPPDARVTTRNFRVRIESRQVDFRKDAREGIGAADEIGVLLNKKRGVQLSRAGDYKFR